MDEVSGYADELTKQASQGASHGQMAAATSLDAVLRELAGIRETLIQLRDLYKAELRQQYGVDSKGELKTWHA